MDSATLDRCIQSLGSSYEQLVAMKVIPDLPLQNVYEGGDSLVVEPEAGIELIFWPATQRLEEIQITLGKNFGVEAPVYAGELPAPYFLATTRALVRATFGTPLRSEGRFELPGTQITLGGCDTYQAPATFHDAAFVDFQYDEALRVDRIAFALIDRN